MNLTHLFAKEKIERFSENNFEELHESLSRLSSKKQQAVQMRFFDDLTIDQISQAMGITWGDTDKLIKYALSDLREMLEAKLNQTLAIQAA